MKRSTTPYRHTHAPANRATNRTGVLRRTIAGAVIAALSLTCAAQAGAALPTVTITAITPQLQENIKDLGTFQLQRTGDTSTPLTVFYTTTNGIQDVKPPQSVAFGFLSGPFAPLNTPLTKGTVVAYVANSNTLVLGENDPPPAPNDPNYVKILLPTDGVLTSYEKSPGASVSGQTPIAVVNNPALASAGQDFVPLPGTATFAIGQSTTDIELIPMEDDDPSDGNETLTLTLTANVVYTVGSPKQATVTIMEGPYVTVVASDPTASRPFATGSGQVPADTGTFTFSRTGDTSADLAFGFTLSGTAVNGTDYATLPTQVTIPAGQSSADVTVTPLADGAAQGVKTVIVSDLLMNLTAPAGGFLSGPLANPGNPVSVGKPVAYLVSTAQQAVAADGCTCNLPADAVPVQMPQFGSGQSGAVTDFTFQKNVGDSIQSGDVIAVLQVPTGATVTITDTFNSPIVELTANQGGDNRRLLTTGGGNVTVTANVTDLNPGDTATYDWSATDNALVPLNGTTNNTFVFDPSSLAAGLYTLRATVTDSSLKSTQATLLVEVFTSLPDLDKDTDLDNAGTHPEDAVDDVIDSDGDGVPDASEGYTDSDNDGIPDYLDSSKLAANELQELPLVADTFIITAEPGLTLKLGDVAFAAGSDSAGVTFDDIAKYGGPDLAAALNTADPLQSQQCINNPGLQNAVEPLPYDMRPPSCYPPYVYLDFTVGNILQEGSTATVVVPQQYALPVNPHYRVFHPTTGWQDFVVNGDNRIASCCSQDSLKQNNAGNHGDFPGSNGNCPAPGSSDYTSGLKEGDMCVQLTIQDGGPNDTDGAANHVITDPSVVASAPAAATTENGNGALAPPVLMILLGIYLLATVRMYLKSDV